MNRQIRRLTIGILLAYVALFVQLNRIQVFNAAELRAKPDNTRDVLANFSRPRGTIATIDGEVVARSVEVNTPLLRQREYPQGELFAQVSGFFSLHYGSSGVERYYDEELSGQTPSLELRSLADLFVDRDRSGSVVLSLRSDLQRIARDELGDREGSVVALDPRTGEILALWSWPSFDPNAISVPDQASASQARGLYLLNPANPMLGRAYQERYFPGSSFKVVVSAAGLESGLVTLDEPSYPRLREWEPPLTTRAITNAGRATCGGTLADILRVSCNTAFAEMGSLTLGPRVLADGAEGFGFNDRPPIDLPAPASSVFPTDFGEALQTPDADRPDPEVPGTIFENTPALAQAAIGQNDVAATPLQMALVAAGVANNGQIMAPRVVHEIRDADGGLVRRYDPRQWKQAMTPSNAAALRQAMIGVVEGGTARAMAIPGMVVGGKTGTARVAQDSNRSHAWIIGFAGPPGETPHVAVAVVVLAQEGGGEQTGGRVAAPIARALMEAALSPPEPNTPVAGGEESPPHP